MSPSGDILRSSCQELRNFLESAASLAWGDSTEQSQVVMMDGSRLPIYSVFKPFLRPFSNCCMSISFSRNALSIQPCLTPFPAQTRTRFHSANERNPRCLGKARIQLANDYVRWRLSDPAVRQERRPSLKVFLQGPNSVRGVDGRPVLLIRRSSGFSLNPAKRQLSFNCPRYISVGVYLVACLPLASPLVWLPI